MTTISKIWPGLSLAIIALLAFLLIRGCAHPVPASVVDGVGRGYDSAKAVDSPVIARLTREKDSIALQRDSLIATLLERDQDLRDRAGDLSTTMAALDQARSSRDTVAQLAHADTLEAQVKAGIPAVEGYTHLTDSLIHACIAQGEISDSIVSRLTRINHIADSTISRQQLYYEILNKDDRHKTAQLKFYKPVAIGGAAAAAIVIVLKIIAH